MRPRRRWPTGPTRPRPERCSRSADVLLGRSAEAVGLTHAAATAFDELSKAELATRLDGAHFLNMAEMYTERFETMIAHAKRASEVASASRQGGLLGVLALSHGFGAAILGRLDEARGRCSTARSRPNGSPAPPSRCPGC